MDLIQLLIVILVLGLVFALLYWLIEQFPLPAPFAMVARAVLALIIVLLLLGMVFGQISVPMFKIGR